MKITEFKAKCTQILRNLSAKNEPIEITSRGRIVALISPPKTKDKTNPLYERLQGRITYHEDWDEPLGDTDWNACKG